MIWLKGAACKDRPDLPWDSDAPYRGNALTSPPVTTALAVCHRCPVRLECLADADDTEVGTADIRGIRGGLTAPERLRRRIG